MSQDKLLIFSGWRRWTDQAPVYEIYKQFDPVWTTVIVGDCPTGLDPIAKRVGESLGFFVSRFFADWNQYGDSAGPKRNEVMQRLGLIHQRLGIQVYAAVFLHPSSRGTKGMHRLCQLGGFDTYIRHWQK